VKAGIPLKKKSRHLLRKSRSDAQKKDCEIVVENVHPIKLETEAFRFRFSKTELKNFIKTSGERSVKSSCPHPKISPKQTDLFPKTTRSSTECHQPFVVLRRSNSGTCPLLVPMFLQLTFLRCQSKPSDALLRATIVPSGNCPKTRSFANKAVIQMSFFHTERAHES